jgi:hypothetical protein
LITKGSNPTTASLRSAAKKIQFKLLLRDSGASNVRHGLKCNIAPNNNHYVDRDSTGLKADRRAVLKISGAFRRAETLLAPARVVLGKVSGRLELRAG